MQLAETRCPAVGSGGAGRDGAVVGAVLQTSRSHNEPQKSRFKGQPTQAEIKFRNKNRRPPSITTLRVRELNIVRARRYGETVPDTATGCKLIEALAIHLASVPNGRRRIIAWLELRAPWMDDDRASEIATEASNAVERGVRPWSADKLGRYLDISMADRAAWRLTTIGAVGDSTAKRKARRKAADRAYQAAKRRAAGATPRSESAARTKPWVAAGVSRATWYRRQKQTDETNSSAATLLYGVDESVSLARPVQDSQRAPAAPRPVEARPSASRRAAPSPQHGLGDLAFAGASPPDPQSDEDRSLESESDLSVVLIDRWSASATMHALAA